MYRLRFEEPSLEIVQITSEDVIATSNFDPSGLMDKEADDWYRTEE